MINLVQMSTLVLQSTLVQLNKFVAHRCFIKSEYVFPNASFLVGFLYT